MERFKTLIVEKNYYLMHNDEYDEKEIIFLGIEPTRRLSLDDIL